MTDVNRNSDHRCYKLGTLLVGYDLPASVSAIDILALSCDSRTVTPGSLFFALAGHSQDGRQYIDAAVSAGASAVVCEDSAATANDSSISWRGDVPVIGVRHVRTVLGLAAAEFFGNPSRGLAVTGVTGTNGKSTCVALLAQLEQALGHKAGVIGTLGYGFAGESLSPTGMTTPDAISAQRMLRELADRQVQVVAMEVSSHGLAQSRVAGIDISKGIFTNLSRDHLDYHASMDAYAEAKAQLFALPSLRHAVINLDDRYSATMSQALPPGAQLWTYSLRQPLASVYASRIEFLPDGMRAVVRTPWGSGEIHTALLGEFNLYNLLAVMTATCAGGADFQTVLSLLPRLTPVPGRMEKIEPAADIQVVVDYAHTPEALRQVLASLRLHGNRKIHAVFGCGGDRDKGKRPQMAAVAEAGADSIIVTNDNPRTEAPSQIIRDIIAGASHPEKIAVVEDRAEAIACAVAMASPGDVVLIAGKGHENYQIIGTAKVPFDDAAQARLALQARVQKENG